jgi:hypothetical protein
MPRRRFYVGPDWPTRVSDYDYLRPVGDADWAWEYLRRNPAYQREHRLNRLASEQPVRHARGLLLTRTRRRCRRAEAWDLYSFRGSAAAGARGAGHLAAEQQASGHGSPRRSAEHAPADFRADALPGLASIHVDPSADSMSLSSPRRRVTICFRGRRWRRPGQVTFELTGLAALFAAQRNVATLQLLFDSSARPRRPGYYGVGEARCFSRADALHAPATVKWRSICGAARSMPVGRRRL